MATYCNIIPCSGWVGGLKEEENRTEEKRAWHLARKVLSSPGFSPRPVIRLSSASRVGHKGGKEKRKKVHGRPLGIEPQTTSIPSAARLGIAATEWQLTGRGKQAILACQERGTVPETISAVTARVARPASSSSKAPSLPSEASSCHAHFWPAAKSGPSKRSPSASLSVCLCLCLAACCLSKGSANERRKKDDLCRIDSSLPFHSFGVLQRAQGHACCHFQQDITPRIEPTNPPRWCSSVVRASD